MIVAYLNEMSKENKLYYTCVIIGCVWFFTSAFKADVSFVVAVVTAFFIIFYENDKTKSSVENLNTGLHYKLNSLLENENHSPPVYFYMEPDMINFFYDIRDFRVYNRDSYLSAIKAVDALLRIKKELENDYKYVQEPKLSGWQNFGDKPKAIMENNIKNHKAIFENAEISGQKAINHIHSFTVSLPEGIYSEKHKKAFEKFHILVKRILDDILRVCKKSSSDPLIGQSYGLPKPIKSDKSLSDSFDFVHI